MGRQSGDSPSGVGLTALIVAQARAAESQRSDRLFEDPFARTFVGLAGPEFVAAAAEMAPRLRLRGNGSYFAIRTRFFDDCLLDAVRAGIRQVVLLGAGLDTRAYRLDLPAETSLFELDLPDVLAFKARALDAESAAPRCRRIVVPVDLRSDWPDALLGAGFASALPTAWLAEGILMYLTEPERDRLLELVGLLSAPGSRLVLDQRGVAAEASTSAASRDGAPSGTDDGDDERVRKEEEEMADARRRVDEAGAAIAGQFGTRTSAERPDPSMVDPAAWLARHGWHAAVFGAAERFASHNRPIPEALRAGATQIWLATAQRG